MWDFDAAEGDRIRITDIDANVYAAGDQDLTFIGHAAFSGAPGEMVRAATEGVIHIEGIYTPQASWFVL